MVAGALRAPLGSRHPFSVGRKLNVNILRKSVSDSVSSTRRNDKLPEKLFFEKLLHPGPAVVGASSSGKSTFANSKLIGAAAVGTAAATPSASGFHEGVLSASEIHGVEGWCERALLARQKILELLPKQNSEMTAAIVKEYADNPVFLNVSKRLCDEIIQRDHEDGEKLTRGIQLAMAKKVLLADVTVEPKTIVSVSDKSIDDVADEIIDALRDAPSRGCVVTLQGLSGTGKGTTVAKLKEKLPNAQTWSNGNIFRSLTLLAVTAAEQRGCRLQDVLTAKDLEAFVKMLEFNQFNGQFDVKIEGLGIKHLVSDIEKTILKDPKIRRNITTVAEVTQGEVVNFVQKALHKMAKSGVFVLLEGREQTLNHIRSPHRFELVLDDQTVIGQRQVALQMGAKALAKLMSTPGDRWPGRVRRTLDEALAELDQQP